MNDHNMLLTIAHPDDECMFFLPALMHFRKQGCNVHVLCLSTGNADGMGAIRKQELYYSCSVIGIERGSVAVIDDARLPDGMAAVWPSDVVAEHVEAAVRKYSTSTVLTFDNKGVSGHQNHISTSEGVLYAVNKLKRGQFSGLKLYMLATNNILRKYIFPLDLVLSLLTTALQFTNNNKKVCCIGGGPLTAWPALRAHHSQFVWFRKLFILFSSYIYINTLIPVI